MTMIRGMLWVLVAMLLAFAAVGTLILLVNPNA